MITSNVLISASPMDATGISSIKISHTQSYKRLQNVFWIRYFPATRTEGHFHAVLFSGCLMLFYRVLICPNKKDEFRRMSVLEFAA